MRLFVGGPRHGAAYNIEDATFLDVQTGTFYAEEPVTFTTLNEITKRPEWTYEVVMMVHQSIVDIYGCQQCQRLVEPEHVQQPAGAGHSLMHQPRNMFLQEQVQDAALRHLFYTTGQKRRPTGMVAPPAEAVPQNGAGTPPEPVEPPTVYLMTCETCEGDTDWSFPTLLERAEHAGVHLREHPEHSLKFETETVDDRHA